MNIKSLLLGSVAAMAAVSGAQAADAIVAAEPEPVEYVKVCDAFGKGYFYIPGTETCLKLSGYVRTQLSFKADGYGINGKGDYDAESKATFNVEAKSDTEFGALTGYINFELKDTGDVNLDGAWINVAGFDVGNFYNWWDDGINGDGMSLGSSRTRQNAIRYTYDGGGFTAGAAVEELVTTNASSNDDIGLSGKLGYAVGGVSAWVIASYDFDADEAAFKGKFSADVGPGTFQLAGIYAADPSYYWSTSEWTVAGSYSIKATDKLTITPAVQYFGDYGFVSGTDAWQTSLTAGYQLTEGLRTLASVKYFDEDGPNNDQWTGFLRLQRDF